MASGFHPECRWRREGLAFALLAILTLSGALFPGAGIAVGAPSEPSPVTTGSPPGPSPVSSPEDATSRGAPRGEDSGHSVAVAAASPAPPILASLGVYITHLGSVDLHRNAFDLEFWYWTNSVSPDYNPTKTLDVVNGADVRMTPIPLLQREGIYWGSAKISAAIRQVWDIRDFPFDTQSVAIVLEDRELTWEQLRFSADTANSRIDQDALIRGWRITGFSIEAQPKSYRTSFGEPGNDGISQFSRVLVSLKFKRQGWALIFSVFIGFFISALISTISFTFRPDPNVGPRVGLLVGAIFGSIGNKFALESRLPLSEETTLADIIQLATFSYILAALAFSILIPILLKRLPEGRVRLLNFLVGVTLFLTYSGSLGFRIHNIFL
ncbi:MAG: hypothetical protein HQL59_09330 [Magnetococcales bacterium]|nr:hypothetical protein [Magnetococcales bacterium]